MATSGFVIQGAQIQRASTEEHIKWCVRSVLSMQKGELLSDPDLGADLMPLMFRRDSPKLREEVKQRVESTLLQWEPRIELESTEILPDESEPELLSVKIRYRIKDSQRVETVKVFI